MSDKPDKPKELILLAVLLVITVGGLWVFSGFLFSVVADFEAAQWLAAISTLAIAVLTFILAFETLKMRKGQEDQIQYLLKKELADGYYRHRDSFKDHFDGVVGFRQLNESANKIHSCFFRPQHESSESDVNKTVCFFVPDEVSDLYDFISRLKYLELDYEKPRMPLAPSIKESGLTSVDFDEYIDECWKEFVEFISLSSKCFNVFYKNKVDHSEFVFNIRSIDFFIDRGDYDFILKSIMEDVKSVFVFIGLVCEWVESDYYSRIGADLSDLDKMKYLSCFSINVPSYEEVASSIRIYRDCAVIPDKYVSLESASEDISVFSDESFIDGKLKGKALHGIARILSRYKSPLKPKYYIYFFSIDR